MRPFKIKIPVGADYELSAVGDYVRLKAASVAVTVRAPDNNETVELEQGDDAVLSAFSRLRLSHADAAEQIVTVYVGKGTRAGSSKVGGAVAVSNFPASVAVNGPMVNAAKAVTNASAQVLAANAARRFLMVQNKDAAGSVWVTLDGSAATTGNGIKIAPGSSLILDVYTPVAAIMAIGDIASNANIVVVEG